MKFYVCKHCGNIMTKLISVGVPIQCCAEEMALLEPNVTDAAVEKHVPVVTVDGNQVKVVVGNVIHPMTPEHSILWVALETETGASIQWLQPGEAPEAVFALADGQSAKTVYAYCNLHGLWKANL